MRKLVLIAVMLMLTPVMAYSATTWFMPEGSTQGSFELYILVNNPSASSAEVKYTFYTDTETITLDSSNAPAGFTANCTITAGQRSTLNVNSLSGQTGFTGLSGKPISTKVESTNGVNIVAERAMYWDDSSMPWDAGHATRGVSGVEGCYTEIGQPSSFPITINTTGSYKLISSIVCSTQDVNAIEITSGDVTLDLNGFTIAGPGPSSGSSGNGIDIAETSSLENIAIHNGTIKNFRSIGINIINNAYGCTFHDLKFIDNGRAGIVASLYISTIRNCIFWKNGRTEGSAETGALYLGSNGVLIKDNVFMDNYGYGIYISGGDNLVEKNLIYSCNDGTTTTGQGIYTLSGANRIEGNHVMACDTNDIVSTSDETWNINNSYQNANLGVSETQYLGQESNNDLNE